MEIIGSPKFLKSVDVLKKEKIARSLAFDLVVDHIKSAEDIHDLINISWTNINIDEETKKSIGNRQIDEQIGDILENKAPGARFFRISFENITLFIGVEGMAPKICEFYYICERV